MFTLKKLFCYQLLAVVKTIKLIYEKENVWNRPMWKIFHINAKIHQFLFKVCGRYLLVTKKRMENEASGNREEKEKRQKF